jgi:diacylglycerol kinase (ATP)
VIDDIAPQVTLIVNPAAGQGRGARARPAARAAFASLGTTVVLTARAGDERQLAREALARGATTIAALGGDGTWSNIAATIIEAQSDCALAPLDAGTGSDWVKSVRVPADDPAAMAMLVAAGRAGAVDAGVVEDGGATPTWFVNVASFGFAAAATAVAARARWLRGDSLYLYAALTQLFGFRGFALDCETMAGNAAGPPRHLLVAAAVGRHFGGKFAIAPDADPTDGLLDVVRIADAGPLRRARLFAAAGRGAHVGEAEVSVQRAPWVRLRFPTPPAYETDGELRQAASTTITVRCLPGALRVVGAPTVTR